MTKTILMTAVSLGIAASASAATIHVFAGDAGDLSAPATVGDVFTQLGTDSLTGIAGVADGVAFTYDITFTNAALAGDLLTQASGTGDFADGVVYTINVTNITPTGGTVNFDGITNFSTSNTGNGEGVTIGGISYLRGTAVNSDNDPRNGVNISDSLVNSTTFTSVGTTRLESFALQFTGTVAVPEPSSTALLGLGGLALILRRRK